MKIRKLLAATIVATSLSACASQQIPTNADGTLVKPEDEVVIRLINNYYRGLHNRLPEDLVVRDLKVANAGLGQDDYFVCFTTTEKAQFTRHQGGKVVIKPGDPLTETTVSLLRYYPDEGWGLSIWRPVSAGSKIGTIATTDLCVEHPER
jgi:hypothetical protein